MVTHKRNPAMEGVNDSTMISGSNYNCYSLEYDFLIGPCSKLLKYPISKAIAKASSKCFQ